jgi:hypothetical protein
MASAKSVKPAESVSCGYRPANLQSAVSDSFRNDGQEADRSCYNRIFSALLYQMNC